MRAVFVRGVVKCVEWEPLYPGFHWYAFMEDLIRSLQLEVFWKHKNKATYPVLAHLQVREITLVDNQRCPEQFQPLIGQVEELHQDFKEFEECDAESELCQFFGVGCSWSPSSRAL